MSDVPAQIGRYLVKRKLGAGGMGEVFLAYSPAGSPVAVKLIRSDRLDPSTRARFEREASIARTVIGTNRVARFLEADPYAARPWLAMEYVPGYTLLQYVDEYRALPLPLVASLGALVAEGLEAVHDSGLLHRDLKPQNVMLGADGPMIIDFGLAALQDASSSHDSLSHSGMIIGSVRCMPPEQAGGNPRVTAAADVYALGTVLLYAAAAHYPYDGRTWQAIVTQVTDPRAEPDLSDAPPPLLPLLRSMLAHEPEMRPSVIEVAEACAALMRGVKITPADARLALIARTTAVHPSLRGDQVPPISIEERLAEMSPKVGEEQPGPLDVPPIAPPEAETEAESPESLPEAAPRPAPDAPEARSPAGRPPRRPGRGPASTRVAQELRAEYATQPTL
ncbi:serine/threonine-protein kinase [Micromonospora cabrerizensis]|uniref:serine/threonine-protein kinase n=1 Tax=Micromonospora TaxID=1873 RepID=UPI001EE7A88C|nr:serine/threonine-protein kinase [Micromonospora cabrerizensis]MCG5471378.1 serine/threonine protein kinase [Micromonospora cabrerizensis]